METYSPFISPLYFFFFRFCADFGQWGGGIAGLIQVIRKSMLEICMLQILGIGDYASNHGAVWYISSLFLSRIFLYGCLQRLSKRKNFFILVVLILLGYFSQFLFASLYIAT